jgi:hypothetical protein
MYTQKVRPFGWVYILAWSFFQKTYLSVFKVNKNILRFFLAATCCLNVFGTIPDLSIWFSLSISSIDFACEMASLNKVKIYECVRKLVLILS